MDDVFILFVLFPTIWLTLTAMWKVKMNQKKRQLSRVIIVKII